MPETERRAGMQAFNDRQVGRMALVGCTEQNRPVIEESFRFVLDTLDRHVRAIPFLFGSRPSLADFGLFGQLQILSVDPTRRNLCVAEYVTPERFDEYRDLGLSMGFKMVFSGPLVRSSYMADLVNEQAARA